MNTKDLKYFHSLVKNKNFSTVAEEFNVSQPTISMAIRRLEDTFQTTLFTRDQLYIISPTHTKCKGLFLTFHIAEIKT